MGCYHLVLVPCTPPPICTPWLAYTPCLLQISSENACKLLSHIWEPCRAESIAYEDGLRANTEVCAAYAMHLRADESSRACVDSRLTGPPNLFTGISQIACSAQEGELARPVWRESWRLRGNHQGHQRQRVYFGRPGIQSGCCATEAPPPLPPPSGRGRTIRVVMCNIFATPLRYVHPAADARGSTRACLQAFECRV